MENNFNIDNNTMNQIKNLVDNGNISDALSKISPEMIQNFQNMLNSNSSNSNQNNKETNTSNNLDLSKIDMNTMMKITSMLNNMNNKDDPRTNLIYSLKPYLRDSKKEKIDQYANLLNITKMADLFNKTNPGQQSHD